MAASLVARFSEKGDRVYDPFAGCGTLAFEAWIAGRQVVANDLSPYAHLLTRAKLFPYRTRRDALKDIDEIAASVQSELDEVDLRKVPLWVREFFHPETLREVLAWTSALTARRRWFLLACLLGILHHQRPGFLSFPSSHAVPYLRTKKFPRSRFPDLYEYRPLRSRLEAKVLRAYRRVPELDFQLARQCFSKSADRLTPSSIVDVIVTSPPYMRQLDYGRDNRLRLWFLGCRDWRALDEAVSPREDEFLTLMEACFRRWRSVLKPGGYCVLVIGDRCSREDRSNLPRDLARLATRTIGGYALVGQHTEAIPNNRRVRRGITGSPSETILVFKNGQRRRQREN